MPRHECPGGHFAWGDNHAYTTPGYFQEIMDKLSKVLQGVAVYMDDILVSGTTAAEHLQNLHALLRRLEES